MSRRQAKGGKGDGREWRLEVRRLKARFLVNSPLDRN